MSARRWRILVAEDEEPARARLVRLVGEHADLELVTVCRNGHDAAVALAAGGIDIALLDIEMPGPDGMTLLRDVDAAATPSPVVIIATAHPQFAVDAFACEAVDYLLKPFDAERFTQALRVARNRLLARAAVATNARVRAAIGEDAVAPSAQPAPVETPVSGRLLVRENGRLRILRDEQIDWIEADGRQCIVHCAGKDFRVAGPLRGLAASLRQGRFAAVSRAALVNLDRIAELQEMFKGGLIAVLKNGAQVRVSRRFRTQLLAQLGAPAA